MENLARSSPEAMGVDRGALKNLIKELDAFHGVHSLMVLRGGQVVAEANWAPYQPEQPHLMFSVTKTFTAIAIGLLIAEGKLSLETRVIDLLPEAAPPKPSRKLQKMMVWHLLTMTTGHVSEPKLGGRDWAKTFLRHPVKADPGSYFIYNTPASHMLSVIVTRLTGETLFDYLKPRLFWPLGIPTSSVEEGLARLETTMTNDRAQIATWSQDPLGFSTGGFGLSLCPEGLAKLGQLLLQGGMWQGKQLIPADWVAEMMARQVDSSTQGWGPNSAAGYGYQMWRCPINAARADGAFGQFAIVWPEHDAVIITTSGVAHDGPHSNYALLDTIYKALEHAFIPPPSAGQATSSSCAQSQDIGKDHDGPVVDWLTLPLPEGAATSGIEEKVDGVKFRIEGTKDTVMIQRAGDLLELCYSKTPAVTHRAAYGSWNHYSALGPDGGPQPAAASYAWLDDHTLVVQTYGTATPFGWTHTLTWDNAFAAVTVTVQQNVAFVEVPAVPFVARR